MEASTFIMKFFYLHTHSAFRHLRLGMCLCVCMLMLHSFAPKMEFSFSGWHNRFSLHNNLHSNHNPKFDFPLSFIFHYETETHANFSFSQMERIFFGNWIEIITIIRDWMRASGKKVDGGREWSWLWIHTPFAVFCGMLVEMWLCDDRERESEREGNISTDL